MNNITIKEFNEVLNDLTRYTQDWYKNIEIPNLIKRKQ